VVSRIALKRVNSTFSILGGRGEICLTPKKARSQRDETTIASSADTSESNLEKRDVRQVPTNGGDPYFV